LSIHFFAEGIVLNLKEKKKLKSWITSVIVSEGKSLGEINVVFGSDDYILGLNKKYLNHGYFTDIVTFNYNSLETISGDIFISIDTVRKNADFYNIHILDEIHRVIIHGILHLLGFDDKNKHQKSIMRFQENKWLDDLRLNYL